jgi:hypothetical protein
MARVPVLAIVTSAILLLAACGSPAASPTDTVLPSVPATTGPSPTARPTANPTPSPSPPATLDAGWTELTDAPVPFLHDVTTAPWGYLGVGMASDSTDAAPIPAIWRSTDGLSWEEEAYELPTGVPDVVEALYQVEALGGGFAALGSAWYGIAVSDDGVTWTYETLGDGACPSAIAANDEVLVAVGSIGPCGMGGGPGTPAIWVRDADGWTQLDPPVSTGWFVGVVATPYGFTAWGTVTESADSWNCQIGCTPDLTLEPFANAPWSSADGWTWARADDSSPFVGATVDGVAAASDTTAAIGFVADPATGSERLALWTSRDGDTWSLVEADLPFAEVPRPAGPGVGGGGAVIGVWARQLYDAPAVEAPTVTIWTSPDGGRWTDETTIVADLRGVSALGDGLIAYGTVPRSAGGSQEPCNKDEVLAGTCRNVAAAWVYVAR